MQASCPQVPGKISRVIDKRYRILDILGSGGSGTLFKVRDLTDGGEKALKLLKVEEHTRFEREFLSLKSLRHPNLVAVDDFGRHGRNRVYYTMELLHPVQPGMHAWIRDGARFLDFVKAVMEALRFLHSKKWVHRDVKTANVLLSDPDDPSTARLSDFGLARLAHENDPSTCGTLEYMPPETLFEGKADARSDLYSAGVMLFEIWSGALPFPERTAAGILKAKDASATPVALEAPPGMPETIRRVVERLLQPDPVYRFSSAEEVLEEVAASELDRAAETPSASGSRVRLLRPAFLDREDEMSKLFVAYQSFSDTRKASPLLLSGPFGSGKTRLIEEFKTMAQVRGARFTLIECREGDDFLSVMRRLTGMLSVGPDQIKELAAVVPPEIMAVVPGAAAHPGEPARHLTVMFEGLRRLLCEMTRLDMHVIAVDDVHLADDTTMKFFGFLSRAPECANHLLVLSMDWEREAFARPAGAPTWEEGGAELLRTPLRPFGVELTGNLVAAALGIPDLSDALARWTWEHSGGLPGRILDGWSALVSQGHVQRRRGRLNIEIEGFDLSSLPWNDRADASEWREWLDGLSPKTARVLQTAAALGTSFDLAVLIRLSAVGADPVVEALDQARSAGLLVGHNNARERFSFATPAVAKALVARFGSEERRSLHRRAAVVLDERKGAPEEIAAHHEAAGDRTKAFSHALDAARQSASVLAHAEAERRYTWALSLCGNAPLWKARRLDVLKESAEVLGARGDLAGAGERYREMLSLLSAAGDRRAKIDTIKSHAWVTARMGRRGEAEHMMREALERHAKVPGVRAGMLHTLGLIAARGGSLADACRSFAEALKDVEGKKGREGLELAVRCSLSSALMRLGRIPEATEQSLRAIELARAQSDLHAETVCHNNLGCIYWSSGRFGDARDEFDEVLRGQKKIGNLAAMSACCTNLALACYTIGEWEEAFGHHRQSLLIAEQIDDRPGVLRALNNLGILAGTRGECRKAGECLERAMALAVELEDSASIAIVEGNLGDIALRMGDRKGAAAHFLRAMDLSKELGLRGELAEAHRRTAEMNLAEGNPQSALAHCEIALEILSGAPAPVEMGILKRILGEAQHRLGEMDSSLKFLADSMRILRRTGNLYETARTMVACGIHLHERKRFRKAEWWIKSAERVFERVRALDDLERARKVRQRFYLESRDTAMNRWQMLLKAGLALNETLDLEKLLGMVMDMVIEVTNAKRGFLMLKDAAGSLTFKMAAGEIDGHDIEKSAVSRSLIAQVVETKKAVVVTDVWDSEAFRRKESILSLGIKSMMCVPLLSRGDFIGLIYVDNRDAAMRVFSNEDLALFEALAAHAAISIVNARLIEELHASCAALAKSKSELETTCEELKETQLNLVQAAKMSVMGQIASSIGHELNQPLSAIVGYSDVLLAHAELPASEVRSIIGVISHESLRMAELVTNIRSFSRKAGMERSRIDVNAPMREVLAVLKQALTKAGVCVTNALHPEPIMVLGNANQLQQVFLNLLTNAIDAMENSETRSITVATAPAAGDWVVITIADTGPGIPENVRRDLFKPFVTTKGEGKGTGLGLSITHGIIKSHKGKITVESEPGRGAKFTVRIPALAS